MGNRGKNRHKRFTFACDREQEVRQFEREPGEFIVDAWVVERATLVAEQRGRIVAASHLRRYANADYGDWYRNAGELRWFLF